jgi:hypothetical protein
MAKNTLTVEQWSSEKRNLGWVKIRRGLRDHLHRSRMSSNASTLFVWLLLSAYHSGPKRGCLETNIDDLMRGLGWSRSMVKRTIEELVRKDYILFSGAANQHGLGTITIFKFDVESRDSARSTTEPSTDHNISARLSAQSTCEPSSELSNPSISQNEHGLQTPKNVKKYRNKEEVEEDAATASFQESLKPRSQEIHPCWNAIGQRPFGSPKFQRVWELTRDEQPDELPLSEIMEIAIQECNSLGIAVPPTFYRAKRKVEKKEAEDSFPTHEIPGDDDGPRFPKAEVHPL